MFVIDESMSPELYPLAWLVGSWHGEGQLGYPTIEDTAFIQDVTFEHDGGPYLEYHSIVRVPANEEERETTFTVEPSFSQIWSVESGYWRVVPGTPDAAAQAEQSRRANGMLEAIVAPIEVMLAEPTGHSTIYTGQVNGARIDLTAQSVSAAPSASALTESTRMYGLVNGALLWALDIAAFDQPLQSYAAGRLVRLAPAPDTPVTTAVTPEAGDGPTS